MKRRKLTSGEVGILKMIREGYGPQNTEKDIFFTDAGEAALFVKAPDGTTPIMVVLSNLAAWREDGTIASDEELRRDWLHIPSV